MKKIVALVILLLALSLARLAVAGEIHEAVKKNDIKKVKTLLSQSQSVVNAREKMAGMTPLHIAAIRGHREILSLLLSKGAEINSKDTAWGFTPLHLAKNRNIAEILLSRGAQINARDNYGGTPLFAAVTKGNKDVVAYLLSRKADVNAKTTYGMTSLQKATSSNYTEIADLLKKNGAKE